MKLSKSTIEILKNFASINQGIIFKVGKELRTMSIMKNIFAVAEIVDDIPTEFAIYDLNELLATYSIFSDCEVTFDDSMLIFSVPGEKIEYYHSSPSVVVSPGDKTIKLPSEDMSFVMTKEVLDKIIRSASIMKLKDLVIDKSGITILNRNTVGNKHNISLTVKCNDDDIKSKFFVKVENLKLIPTDYDVSVCKKGLMRFTSRNEEYPIEYHVALEMD